MVTLFMTSLAFAGCQSAGVSPHALVGSEPGHAEAGDERTAEPGKRERGLILHEAWVRRDLRSDGAREPALEARARGEQPARVAGLPPAGLYRVTGETLAANGFRWPVTGLVVLREEDGLYQARFSLITERPTLGYDTSTQWLGHGEGHRAHDDSTIYGDTMTQLVRASVPGVDVRFPFVPRVVDPVRRTNTIIVQRPGGEIHIQLVSPASEGPDAEIDVTHLEGRPIVEPARAGIREVELATRQVPTSP